MMYSVRKRVSGEGAGFRNRNCLLSSRVVMTKGSICTLMRSLCLVTVKLMVCRLPEKICPCLISAGFKSVTGTCCAERQYYVLLLLKRGRRAFSVEEKSSANLHSYSSLLKVLLPLFGESTVKMVHGSFF